MGGFEMIVLDTQTLIWWVGFREKLSKRAAQYIEKSADNKEILVSSISIWEISLLIKKGRLAFTMDLDSWIQKVEDLPFLQFVPIDNNIATKSVFLPQPLHSDPADRIIIATAICEGATLITSDKKILQYPHVQSVW